MWWLIPVLGLALGVYAGQFLNIEMPAWLIKYMSVAILAALDSVFGGLRAIYEKNFDSLLMLTGFFTNALLAAALAYIGDMLGVDLYYAAVFAFGVRLFTNLSRIRQYIIGGLRGGEAPPPAGRQEVGGNSRADAGFAAGTAEDGETDSQTDNETDGVSL